MPKLFDFSVFVLSWVEKPIAKIKIALDLNVVAKCYVNTDEMYYSTVMGNTTDMSVSPPAPERVPSFGFKGS